MHWLLFANLFRATQRIGRLAAVLLWLAADSALADIFSEGEEAYEAGHYHLAMRLWAGAAEAGDARAAFNLSRLYFEGKGVAQDEREAVRWLKRSATKGYPEAQFDLGNRYHQGTGVPAVPALAAIWWSRAAESGYAPAQYNVGRIYYYGEAVPEDRDTAVYWFRLAAQNGSDQGREALAALGLPVPGPEAAQDGATSAEVSESTTPGPGTSTAPTRPQPEKAAAPEQAAPGTGDVVADDAVEWILSQPRGHFTYQLFASVGDDAALRYVKKWSIPEPLAIYRFLRDDRVWSGVVWGSFRDREEAEKARQALPERVRNDVWLRRFKELRAVLARNLY